MASPVAYAFEPSPTTDVYVIHDCDRKPYVTYGNVIRVRIEVLVTETKIMYDIRLTGGAGTVEFEEADVFVDKATAVAEYDNRIG